MKIKEGTKLNVTLLGCDFAVEGLSFPVPDSGDEKFPVGRLVITDLVDDRVRKANFFKDDGDDFVEVIHPNYKLIKHRNPYREVRVTDKNSPHGVSDEFRVRIWPNGRIEVIERGRRSGFETTAGVLYVQLLYKSLSKGKAPRRGKARR